MERSERILPFNLLIRDGVPLVKIEVDFLDLTLASEMSAVLNEAGKKNHGVLIDFTRVTYIDSVIISTIVKYFVDLRKTGFRIVIFSTGKLVNNLLETTRLNNVLDIAVDLDEAVELVRTPLPDSEMALYSRDDNTEIAG